MNPTWLAKLTKHLGKGQKKSRHSPASRRKCGVICFERFFIMNVMIKRSVIEMNNPCSVASKVFRNKVTSGIPSFTRKRHCHVYASLVIYFLTSYSRQVLATPIRFTALSRTCFHHKFFSIVFHHKFSNSSFFCHKFISIVLSSISSSLSIILLIYTFKYLCHMKTG